MDAAQLLLGNKLYSIDTPTSWDELTPEQFEKVNFIKCTHTNRTAMLFELLMVLLPLTKEHLVGVVRVLFSERKLWAAFNAATMLVFFNQRKLWKFLVDDDVVDSLIAIEWLFDSTKRQTVSHVTGFDFKGVYYEGVRNRNMGGVVWKQMQHADQLASNFVSTKDEQWLNHMAAVLYVPTGQPFNDNDNSIPDRVALFERLGIELKYAIYSNYVQLRESFYAQFKLPQGSTGKPDWKAVTLSVADLGALGTFKEVEMQDAHTVMKYFEKKHQEQPK